MTETTTPAVITEKPLAKLSIKQTVLAQFKEVEPIIHGLAEKYKDVAYAVKTPAGMREAVAARADLRDNGRLFVTKAETRIKGEVNELKRLMSDETERLVAIIKPVEDAVDAQIKAEEKRKEEEKSEKARKEAERTGAHRANIEIIKGYVAAATGQPIEAIERAIGVLTAMEFGPEWEEFLTEALDSRDATVAGLNKLIADERLRLENERLQQELADTKAALAAAAKAAQPTPIVAPAPEKAIPQAAQQNIAPQAHIDPSITAAAVPPIKLSGQTVVVPSTVAAPTGPHLNLEFASAQPVVVATSVPKATAKIVSDTRAALNTHLDSLNDEQLARVLSFCQSRYPLEETTET